MWLQNPDWKVLPTIYFVGGYPRVLTCKYHDGECNLIQINCCIWVNNIPSPVSDQVFHAVVKTWTVNHMTFGYNSTGYQMIEQRTSWKGPDTINVSSVGKTDHGSILIREDEACLYANLTYTKNIIQRLIDDETFSNDHAEVIEEFSKLFQEMLATWNKNVDQIMFLLKSWCPWSKNIITEKSLG